MPQMSTFIKKLEGYADLEVSIIRNTKINKVLKALIKLNTIPRDEEFQFRKRSLDLLSQWNKILGAEPTDAETTTDKDGKASPATNGVHEEKSEEPTEAKKDEASASTEKPAETSEEKAVADAELEKPADEKPAETAESNPEPAAAEEPTPAPAAEEPAKPEAAVPETVEKAPESAPAASEAADVVKATE